MPDPSPNRRRARRPVAPRVALALGVVALVATAGLASCSSSSSGTEEQDAPQAAATVAETFGLDEAGEACLEAELEARPAGRELLTGETEPSAAAQEALVTVLDTCVGHEQFARSMALSITASLPPATTDGPSGTADPTAQADCLEREILALDEAPRRAFMVGLLALGAPPTGELALARNEVTNGLYEACGVEIAG